MIHRSLLRPCVLAAVAFVLLVPSTYGGADVGLGTGEPAEARAAFVDGRWLVAADLGEAAGTASGLALAADALSIHAHYVAPESERPEVLRRAIGLAEEAVRMQPSDPWVRFQLAHAVGRYAQSIPPMAAFREGYVGRSRQLVEDVLELDPEMVHARLQLGSWHADVVAQAGALVARLTHGARAKSALEHYERALEMAGDDLVVYAEVSRGLLHLNRRRHGARAQELLRRAVDIEPRDAYERILHQRAAERLAELQER